MAPTLAELRAQNGPAPLPRASRVVTMIEGQHLLADSKRLDDELTDIALQAARTDEEGERTGPPRKAGEGANLGPRAEEIKAEQVALLDQLAAYQGEISLCGVSGGEWQRFKDDNPPRKENLADLRYGRGACDSSALFADLGRFVVEWDGEPVAAADWDGYLGDRITYADRRDLVAAVVDMHEEGLARRPKADRTSLPTTETSATD